MAATIKDSFNRLAEYFKAMEKGRRTRLIVLVAVGLALIVAASVYLSQTTYAVLYSGMRPEDAGEVMTRLNEMGVEAKAQGSGTIMVEKSVADNVRMQLAGDGYPKSGYNYDVSQMGGGLGTTDMEKNMYRQYQLQEWLRNAIIQLEKVDDAFVLINNEEQGAFVLPKDEKPATASVVLTLKEGQTLNEKEVAAIYALITKAVAGLSDTEVRIIDTKMNLYELKTDDIGSTELIDTQLRLQTDMQKTLQEQVYTLLSQVFGKEGVIVEVHVELDFDKVSTQDIVFAPPVEGQTEGLIVSMKELAELVRNGTEGDVAGFDPNGVLSQYQEIQQDDNTLYSQLSREANYEINEKRTQIERAKGSIRDLSVAVILDSVQFGDNEEDYLKKVKSIVAGAVGVNEARVRAEMLPFKPVEAGASEIENTMQLQQQMQQSMQKAQYIRLAILLGTGIIIMIILLLVVRTLRKPRAQEMGEDSEGIDLLADEDIVPSPEEALAILEKEDTNLASLENYIESSPESVAQLLRNWLSDEIGR